MRVGTPSVTSWGTTVSFTSTTGTRFGFLFARTPGEKKDQSKKAAAPAKKYILSKTEPDCNLLFFEEPVKNRLHTLEFIGDVTCCLLVYMTQVALSVAFDFIAIQQDCFTVHLI